MARDYRGHRRSRSRSAAAFVACRRQGLESCRRLNLRRSERDSYRQNCGVCVCASYLVTSMLPCARSKVQNVVWARLSVDSDEAAEELRQRLKGMMSYDKPWTAVGALNLTGDSRHRAWRATHLLLQCRSRSKVQDVVWDKLDKNSNGAVEELQQRLEGLQADKAVATVAALALSWSAQELRPVHLLRVCCC